LALAVCFLLIPWFASNILTPVFFFRYAIPALAALLPVLGWVLARLQVPLRVLLILILSGISAAAPRFWLITAYGNSEGLRNIIQQAADSCGLHELSLSVRDSVVVNPRAYFVGDIRADLYRRKSLTEGSE
jgi:hypothetical protein